jgi:hypothetical protein
MLHRCTFALLLAASACGTTVWVNEAVEVDAGRDGGPDAGHDAGQADADAGEDAGPMQAADCPVRPHAIVNHPYDGGPCDFVACVGTWRNCNNQPGDGCEIDVSTPANCGGCGITCTPGAACVGGACH